MNTSSLDDAKNAISNFLQNANGEDFDKCDILFKMISAVESTQQSQLFKYVCEVFGAIPSNESKQVPVSKYSTQEDRLTEQYGDIVNSLIKSYGQQNEIEDIFYSKIWSIINESMIFDSEAKKIFALYYVLIDKRIPYFKIDETLLYSMSNDRFQELLRKTAQAGQRIRFILKSEFSQKSEKAAVLINELGIKPSSSGDQQSIEEYELRLMQMVYILREMESDRVASLLSRLQR